MGDSFEVPVSAVFPGTSYQPLALHALSASCSEKVCITAPL